MIFENEALLRSRCLLPCSLAPHIIIREDDLDIELVEVQFGAERLTADGRDYYRVNSKGAVPALELADGQVLTENAIILQYLATCAPAANLIPGAGLAHWRVLELLNYIATELHRGFSPLFDPAITPEARETMVKAPGNKFDFMGKALAGNPYLMGEQFTLADAYAYAVLNWTRPHEIDLTPWANLAAFLTRMEQRPAVQVARQQEGIGCGTGRLFDPPRSPPLGFCGSNESFPAGLKRCSPRSMWLLAA